MKNLFLSKTLLTKFADEGKDASYQLEDVFSCGSGCDGTCDGTMMEDDVCIYTESAISFSI